MPIQGSHRDQRRNLARFVDVDNVWGENISTNMTGIACFSCISICVCICVCICICICFLYFCLFCTAVRRVMRKGRQKCWRSFVLPSPPSLGAFNYFKFKSKLLSIFLNLYFNSSPRHNVWEHLIFLHFNFISPFF